LTRLTERPWNLSNGEAFGWKGPTEDNNPWKGTVPVTPIMDTQLDEVAIWTFLNPCGKYILEKLIQGIEKTCTLDWYEVYLTLFVMLNNFEFIFKDMIEYTTRHGMKVSFLHVVRGSV
jgi:hypothetical protein